MRWNRRRGAPVSPSSQETTVALRVVVARSRSKILGATDALPSRIGTSSSSRRLMMVMMRRRMMMTSSRIGTLSGSRAPRGARAARAANHATLLRARRLRRRSLFEVRPSPPIPPSPRDTHTRVVTVRPQARQQELFALCGRDGSVGAVRAFRPATTTRVSSSCDRRCGNFTLCWLDGDGALAPHARARYSVGASLRRPRGDGSIVVVVVVVVEAPTPDAPRRR